MDKVAYQLTNTDFKSNSRNSPEFLAWVRLFKKAFKAEMAKIGITEIEFSVGHFYVSGFFQHPKGLYYFSISDVRCFVGRDPWLMYRTAKHNKDYTGGMNQDVVMENDMVYKMEFRVA